MLEEKQKKIGVIAASTGNHALALSYHGGQLGKMIRFYRKYENFIINDLKLYMKIIKETNDQYQLWIGNSGIPVTVVMPVVAPIMKVENCKKFGATVVINGADIGESREHALVIAKKKGYMYVNG